MCIRDSDTSALPAIYVATHAQSIEQFDSCEIPIQTGASLSDTVLSPVRDNIGDNISAQNRTFCELTALYWIWKMITMRSKDLATTGVVL